MLWGLLIRAAAAAVAETVGRTAASAVNSGVTLNPTHAISGIIEQLTVTDDNISSTMTAVVNDLAQSVEHEAHFVTLPNRVIPLNITTNEKYISSVEYTFGSGESVIVTPALSRSLTWSPVLA